jgi:hypothetical protein
MQHDTKQPKQQDPKQQGYIRKSRRRRVQYPDRRQFERPPEPDPVAGGEPVPPPKPGKWHQAIRKFLAQREKEREKERERDECGRDRRKVRMPRPYLDSTSNFIPHILALRVNEPGTVSFTVWNDGNYPAWTCYVEVYEGPWGYTSPLSAYSLRGRRIITLHPGERREVSLPWVRMQRTGRIVGIVFDPLLDPRDFAVVEQSNRHITSVHYDDLE